MKKDSKSGMKSEPSKMPTKSRGPVRRETKAVVAELVGKLKGKLKGKLDTKAVAANTGKERAQGELRPNLDRLTVGVDLGDQWSNYCILDLAGETVSEGQLRLHIDGSHPRWFQDERWYDLIVILDELTSEIYYAQLVEEESTLTVMAGLR